MGDTWEETVGSCPCTVTPTETQQFLCRTVVRGCAVDPSRCAGCKEPTAPLDQFQMTWAPRQAPHLIVLARGHKRCVTTLMTNLAVDAQLRGILSQYLTSRQAAEEVEGLD